MSFTFDDFVKAVEPEYLDFVNVMHQLFLDNHCKLEIKEAKQGYVVTYSYSKDKKRIALMNYVFRKKGMMVRIYARHIRDYQSLLNSLPKHLKESIVKVGDCKILTNSGKCSPTCSMGYDFEMEEQNYQKCKNSCFLWYVELLSMEYIKAMIENELKAIKKEKEEA